MGRATRITGNFAFISRTGAPAIAVDNSPTRQLPRKSTQAAACPPVTTRGLQFCRHTQASARSSLAIKSSAAARKRRAASVPETRWRHRMYSSACYPPSRGDAIRSKSGRTDWFDWSSHRHRFRQLPCTSRLVRSSLRRFLPSTSSGTKFG